MVARVLGRAAKAVRCVPLSGLALLAAACNWTEVVSVNGSGEQADYHSTAIDVSESGQFIAFESAAGNLAPTTLNSFTDIYLRDALSGTTRRVSVDDSGVEGNWHSAAPALSADGRYVAFHSLATNLGGGSSDFLYHVFLHDTVGGTTVRVDKTSGGAEPNGASLYPTLSADGRYIAFQSQASDLVPGDTNGSWDIFVHDRVANTTTRVSRESGGSQSNGDSHLPDLSADGRYVAFVSFATNMVVGDSNGELDVFVHDRVTGTTTRASVDSDENQKIGSEVFGLTVDDAPAISANGRYVAFVSRAENLISGEINGESGIFVRDLVLGTTERASQSTAGEAGNDHSYAPEISADGRYVSFRSEATNLVPGDLNQLSDIFVRDRLSGSTLRVSVDALGEEANGASTAPSLAPAGRYVGFVTGATNLVPIDGNGMQLDVVLRSLPEVRIDAVTPQTLPIGATTPVTLHGSGFLSGATPLGIPASNVVIVSENTITMNVAVPGGASPGARDVLVSLPGTGPGAGSGALGVCAGCVTYTSGPGC